MERIINVKRKTGETDIEITLNLDGSGKTNISSGNGFFDHMLNLFARHGNFDLDLKCDGDVYCDFHHSCEDIGIVLGRAFSESLGDRCGIYRYSDIVLPMDEALVLAAVDVSGRGFYAGALSVPAQRVGDFECELLEEFFRAFCTNAGITLHIRQLAGVNSHHIIEAVFKAAGRVISRAVKIDPENKDRIPSTKGVL